MQENDDEKIVHGRIPDDPIPTLTFGQLIFNHLVTQSKKNAELLRDAFTNTKVLNNEFLQQTCLLAESLRQQGYDGPNTVLAVISENSLQYFIPVVASFYNKSIVTAINPTYTPLEMIHCLNITKPKLVFCSKSVVKQLLELNNNYSIEHIIVIDSNDNDDNYYSNTGVKTLQQFIDRKGPNSLVVNGFTPYSSDTSVTPALVLYSSGTTGLPKGVTLSHRNLVVLHTRDPNLNDMDTLQSSFGLLPFFHTFGLNMFLAYLLKNIRIIVMRRFDEDVFLRSIQDYKMGFVSLVPPLAVLLAKTDKLKQYDLSSLQLIGVGAAPLHKSTETLLKQRFESISTAQGYGLTETTLAVIGLPPGLDRAGSCGFVLPWMSCKVRDLTTAKTLGPNQQGELCFKGPTIMMGYYNDETSTREMFTDDGWLKTGDIGYYDEDGYFYIVDRHKELIKYKGFQVPPAELEALILTHPKVEDVGVVGVPDEASGELPLAFVVKRAGEELHEDELKRFVAEKISSHKQLRGGVIFVSKIPKTATGKILRRELRKELEKYRLQLKSKL